MNARPKAPRIVRLLFSLTVLEVAALGGPTTLVAQDTTGEEEALAAAETWLAIVDSGDYERSWSEASATFQSALTADGWAQRVGAVRSQLGDPDGDRGFVGTEQMTDPPGAPAGDYVAVTYSSSFDMLDPAREVVSLVMEDGEWKVVGYGVVPG